MLYTSNFVQNLFSMHRSQWVSFISYVFGRYCGLSSCCGLMVFGAGAVGGRWTVTKIIIKYSFVTNIGHKDVCVHVRLCACACMYVCMCVMYACMCACMCACMYACMHVCMYVCVCMRVCICVYVYVYALVAAIIATP